jgi:hypothetical protein
VIGLVRLHGAKAVRILKYLSRQVEISANITFSTYAENQ